LFIPSDAIRSPICRSCASFSGSASDACHSDAFLATGANARLIDIAFFNLTKLDSLPLDVVDDVVDGAVFVSTRPGVSSLRGDRPKDARTASAESAASARVRRARLFLFLNFPSKGAFIGGLSRPAMRAATAGGNLGAGGGGLKASGLGASYSGGRSLASHSCCQLFSNRRGGGGLGGGAR
jgi:hypothetical protein